MHPAGKNVTQPLERVRCHRVIWNQEIWRWMCNEYDTTETGDSVEAAQHVRSAGAALSCVLGAMLKDKKQLHNDAPFIRHKHIRLQKQPVIVCITHCMTKTHQRMLQRQQRCAAMQQCNRGRLQKHLSQMVDKSSTQQRRKTQQDFAFTIRLTGFAV